MGCVGLALRGAALVNQLRNLPQRHLLVAVIALWALCPIALAFTGSLIAAMIVFGLGGLVWARFTPVAYSFLQSGLASHEQQVVTLWTTGSMVAAPLGLVVGGPLIELAGTARGAGVVRRADAAACPDCGVDRSVAVNLSPSIRESSDHHATQETGS
jgi:hypothetical protein